MKGSRVHGHKGDLHVDDQKYPNARRKNDRIEFAKHSELFYRRSRPADSAARSHRSLCSFSPWNVRGDSNCRDHHSVSSPWRLQLDFQGISIINAIVKASWTLRKCEKTSDLSVMIHRSLKIWEDRRDLNFMMDNENGSYRWWLSEQLDRKGAIYQKTKYVLQ